MIASLVKKLIEAPRYGYNNLLYPRLLSFKHRQTLRPNRVLKNSQRGKRCFILGNGPSINDIDLTLLRDEKTFVVNDFIKHPDFDTLNPSYYVMADMSFFDSERETDFFGRNLKNKSDRIKPSTKLFFNLNGKKLIERRQLFRQHEIYYLSTQGIWSSNFDSNIELDKTIPFSKSVILACLAIATYLGFEKIYLLGCEHSFLAKPIRQGDLNDVDHFYGFNHENLDPNDPQAVKEQGFDRVVSLSYESAMSHAKQLFKNYRLFYQKVRQSNPNLKIWNATPNSFLDVFPFIDFKNIIFKNR